MSGRSLAARVARSTWRHRPSSSVCFHQRTLHATSSNEPVQHPTFHFQRTSTTKRRFSTDTRSILPPPTDSAKQDLSTIRQLTEGIIHCDASTPLSLEAWHHACDVLAYWTSQGTSESVERSLQLVERLLDDRDLTESAYLDFGSSFLNRNLLNAITLNWLHCWKNTAKEPTKLSPHKLLSVLDAMERRCPPMQVSGKALSYLLAAVFYRGGQSPKEAALFAERLMYRMVTPGDSSYGFLPSTANLNASLSLLAKSKLSDARERAERLVNEVSQAGVETNIRTYNTLIHVFSKAGDAQAAEDLLLAFCRDYMNGDHDIRPDSVSFNTAIAAWSKSRAEDAPERAQAILKRMTDPEDLGPLQVEPDIVTWNTILSCWSRSPRADAADQAHVLLQSMKELHEAGEISSRPDQWSYVSVLDAFAKRGDVERATKVHNEMYEAFLRGDESLRPTARTLTTLVDALGRSDLEDRVARAEAIFDQLQELLGSGGDSSSTGRQIVAYNVMLFCYANSANDKALTNLRQASILADQFLEDMPASGVQPDFISYSIVIQAWIKTWNSRRAAKLLNEACDAFDSGDQTMRPDLGTFHSVLRALSGKGKGTKCDALLNRLYAMYDRGEKRLAPTSTTLFLVCTAWANSANPEAARKAEEAIAHFRDRHSSGKLPSRPDAGVYRALLKCWAKHEDPSAADRAVAILDEMKQRFSDGDEGMEPNVEAANQVLHILATHKQPERAETLLRAMYNEYRGGIETLKPDSWSFNTVITAWAISEAPEAFERASALVEHMHRLTASRELDAKPSTVTYNVLLNCLAKSGRKGSAELAERTLQHMKSQYAAGDEDICPNQVSYCHVGEAYIRDGYLDRAEDLLRTMYEGFVKTHDARQKPLRRQFIDVLKALQASNEPGSRPREAAIVQIMHRLYPPEQQQQQPFESAPATDAPVRHQVKEM